MHVPSQQRPVLSFGKLQAVPLFVASHVIFFWQ